MSCGKKIDFGYTHDRHDIADAMRDCLDYTEMLRAESAFRDIGLDRYADYGKRDCFCE